MTVETKDSVYHLSFNNKNSFVYLGGGLMTLGIDWLIEKNHPKRYYYQRNFFLDLHQKNINVYCFEQETKGKLLIDLSVPYVNNIYLKTSKGNQHAIGFLGLSGGLDYFYKQNRSLSLQGGIATDYEIPLLVGVDYDSRDSIERINVLFLNLMNTHTIGSFSMGFGLNISKYKWARTDNIRVSPITNEMNITGLGLCFTANYRIIKNFRTSLLYQPSFLEINNGLHPGYHHLLSLQLQWKFRLN